MFKPYGYYGNPYVRPASYNDFAATLPSVGATVEELGVGSDGVLKIYGMSYGDMTNKPIIYIDADCHGSEWQSSHFAVDFLQRIINRDYPNKPLIDEIADTFAFYVIPSINPWGYENTKYTNFNGVNLNRNTDAFWESYPESAGTVNYKGSAPFSEIETRIMRDKVLEVKPYMAINCHTTSGEKSGIDTGKIFRQYRPMLYDCYRSSKLAVGRELEAGQEWSVGNSPTFTGFYGNQISKEGTPTIPTILEGRSDQTAYNYGLSALFTLAIYAYYFYKTGKQQINDIEEVMQVVAKEKGGTQNETV